MKTRTILIYTTTLIMVLCTSCSGDDDTKDIFSNTYLRIPDASFEKLLIAKGIDTDGVVNKQMLKSDAEVVKELNLENLEYGAISDLSGIEGFTNLKRLVANQHNIEQIDLGNNILLEEIYLAGNYLSSIDVSKNTNTILLDLTANQLTTITGLSKLIKLENLNLSFNYIEELTMVNTSLEILHISNNDLIFLDITAAINITNVLLTTNKLITLDISSNKKLQTLLVSDNQLQSIDLSENKSLTHLHLFSNMLTNLDIGNNQNLIELKVDRNPGLSCIQIASGQNIPTVSLSNNQELNILCN
ncbi:hypothetical protein [Flagellimonas marinaquae]|uniref:hypothetical protein n=1 Tax=Flagellimonas marinaquae TaxID=254955 RepID=UPI00207552D2|nr:hypothetical protein [Allomuricauda aquimarina]USD24779.1 hypothetical protein MJO53_13955 [Allomuricauda aquimarina]